MAATAATFNFVSVNGERQYAVDAYVPDAVATKITFNGSGLAVVGSDNFWQAPEDVYLVDISGAAPTAVGGIITFTGANQTNHTFRWANQLATLSNRMKHKVRVPAGTQFGALQF
jgi:hypothetical protein